MDSVIIYPAHSIFNAKNGREPDFTMVKTKERYLNMILEFFPNPSKILAKS